VVTNSPCTFGIASVFTGQKSKVLGCRRNTKARELKSRRGKNSKAGGSDPTFSAFSRPKSVVGSPPALHAGRVPFFPLLRVGTNIL